MSSGVHHPVFARMYRRIADAAEQKGAGEHRDELLAGLSGRVIEVGAGTGLNSGTTRPRSPRWWRSNRSPTSGPSRPRPRPTRRFRCRSWTARPTSPRRAGRVRRGRRVTRAVLGAEPAARARRTVPGDPRRRRAAVLRARPRGEARLCPTSEGPRCRLAPRGRWVPHQPRDRPRHHGRRIHRRKDPPLRVPARALYRSSRTARPGCRPASVTPHAPNTRFASPVV